MKAKDLIERLQTLPSDTEVRVQDSDLIPGTVLDKKIAHILADVFHIYWSGKSADDHPTSAASVTFFAFREFALWVNEHPEVVSTFQAAKGD